MNVISIKNLQKYYGKNKILNDVNIDLSSEYIYFLTAENGKGKTTFFKCLLKETSFSGQIYDNNIKYAYLPERVNYPSFINPINFIKLFLDLEKESDISIIKSNLKDFEILKYKEQNINTLSKGTKQKILIIKTLLSDADVYLFDEPLTGLDLFSRMMFMKKVNSLNEQGKLVIISTHYYNEYEFHNKKVIKI